MTPLDPPGRTPRTVPATFLAGPDSAQREPSAARRAEPRRPAPDGGPDGAAARAATNAATDPAGNTAG
ncbi:hypothetical protein ACFVXQ_11300, partial [Kitasatospora sp. NPDC058263]